MHPQDKGTQRSPTTRDTPKTTVFLRLRYCHFFPSSKMQALIHATMIVCWVEISVMAENSEDPSNLNSFSCVHATLQDAVSTLVGP